MESNTPSVTWLGHASAVAVLGGRTLLFDPLGRRRARKAGTPDVVVITHAHVDHLNRWTLKSIDRSAHLVVPRGCAQYVRDLKFAKLSEVAPGDHLDLGGVDLVAVPTRHEGGRWRRDDNVLCCGYVARAGGKSVHHAGDVDFSAHDIFDAIGRDHPLDASLLPIGGMMPLRWYQRRRDWLDKGIHIDPDAALSIFERLGARAMVPVHWGTLNIRLGGNTHAPRRRLIEAAAEKGKDTHVRVLAHDETLPL
ncbi:MAG TPA: MBL fold metallo-hydrolase [Kofleriaceae bacterium]|nr:MBL fold metallo-hydrolase [Kofleriaceae bacterium]